MYCFFGSDFARHCYCCSARWQDPGHGAPQTCCLQPANLSEACSQLAALATPVARIASRVTIQRGGDSDSAASARLGFDRWTRAWICLQELMRLDPVKRRAWRTRIILGRIRIPDLLRRHLCRTPTAVFL